ncbi:MAG: glucosamine-6-phosphate deaminase [Pseudomonadales bacterium]|nr:glucosamine-6-phosphate deaminase [Pseudomonadales bacterium]
MKKTSIDGGIELLVADTYDDLSRKAAELVTEYLLDNPEPLTVLPTGDTPLGMYGEMVRAQQEGKASFTDSRFVQLDEYVGIDQEDDRNLYGWMTRVFLGPAGIGESRTIRFDSAAQDTLAEALRIEKAISQTSGIGLQILGLGPNGHLGFNEPGSAFDSRTRVVDLTPASIESNARYWGSSQRVPQKAFTLGLGILSSARKTILLVSEARKAEILARVLEGPVGSGIPATILRQMENVTVIADGQAASKLKKIKGIQQLG